MPRVWTGLGTRTRLLVRGQAQGWCGANSGAGCSVKRGDRLGKAQRWKQRPEAQARGAGDPGFGPGLAASKTETRLWVGGPEDSPGARWASPGGCGARPPVRGAGSPRRAGAAGRWGPGRPCWASAPHPRREGGRGGGSPAPPRLRAWRGPLASSPRRAELRPPQPPRPAAVAAAALALTAWRAGPAGGARRGGAGRRAARPLGSRSHGNRRRARARTGGWRGALPSLLGNCARRGRSPDPRLQDPGLSRAWVCAGRSGGPGQPTAPPSACRGRPMPSADPGFGSGKGRRESGGGAVRPGAELGPPGRARACARACSAGSGLAVLGLSAFSPLPCTHARVFLPAAGADFVL